MSWALITCSAIEGGCNGIMAASSDICDHIIEMDTCEDLFIFPNNETAPDLLPGLYLWRGTMDLAKSGESSPCSWTNTPPEHMNYWMGKNGEDL